MVTEGTAVCIKFKPGEFRKTYGPGAWGKVMMGRPKLGTAMYGNDACIVFMAGGTMKQLKARLDKCREEAIASDKEWDERKKRRLRTKRAETF